MTGAWPGAQDAEDTTPPDVRAAYGAMQAALRDFLDRAAPAKPDAQTAAALTADLRAWAERLAAHAVEESDPFMSGRLDLPGRGKVMAPPVVVTHADDTSMRGTVTFGRFFLGANGVVHGGAIPLLFDDLLGRLANSDRVRARTAYIHTEYRSVAFLNVEHQISAWVERIEGRKRLVRGELRQGATLCAEVEALFVELRPGMT